MKPKRVLFVGAYLGQTSDPNDQNSPRATNADRITQLLSGCELVFATTLYSLNAVLTDTSEGYFDGIVYIGHLDPGYALPEASYLNLENTFFATSQTHAYLGQLYEKSRTIHALQKIFVAKVVLFIDPIFTFPSSHDLVQSTFVDNMYDPKVIDKILQSKLVPHISS